MLTDSDGSTSQVASGKNLVCTPCPPSVGILPSGTYIPKNAVVGSFDLLWTGQTATITTGDGTINETVAGGAWDGSGYFKIEHILDFDLNFKMQTTGFSAFGLSYRKKTDSFSDISFCFLRLSSTDLSIYEDGALIQTESGVLASTVLSISRVGEDILYKIGGVTVRTVTDTGLGYFNADSSFFTINEIYDIEVVIP